MEKFTYHTIAVALLATAILFLGACTNSTQEIKKVADSAELLPLNSQKNIVYEYSDSAVKRLVITSPEVLDFSHAEEPYMEFPQGITVDFFDKLGNEESNLKANYAKRIMSTQMWEARGDVVVVNKKGEQLNTEYLVWDRTEQKIFSNVFTRIKAGDETLMGDGFEADESFTSYKLTGNVQGEIEIEESTTDTTAYENAKDS